MRDLLVDYLRERQPALDYTSLESLAFYLGKRFWADLEQHHPGIDSLHLPAEVADAWKQRLRTKTVTVGTGKGEKTVIDAPRISYRESLTPVRALYLDLAHWAVEDPARWARWVAPLPGRRGGDQPAKSQAPAQVPHGRPHPRTAAGAAGAARQRRSPTPRDRGTARRRPTDPTRPDLHRRRADPHPRDDPAHPHRQGLGPRPGDRAPPRPDPRRGSRLLGPRDRRSARHNRHPRRGTARTVASQPDPVPAAHHRRGRAAAADRAVQDRRRAAAAGRPGPGRRAVRHDPPHPSTLRRRPARAGLRPARMPLAAEPAPLLFQRRINGENRAITRNAVRQLLDAALRAHRADRPGHRRTAALHAARLPQAVHHRRRPQRPAAAHRPSHRRTPRHQRHHGLQGRLPRRGDPGPPGVPRPPPRPAPHRRIPRPRPTTNGRSSSAISNAARSPSAPAAAPSARPASTNTLVSVALCSGQTPLNGTDWSRSATTSPPASPKPNAKAGSAKSKACKSASPPPKTSSPKSTNAPEPASTSGPPRSQPNPDTPQPNRKRPSRVQRIRLHHHALRPRAGARHAVLAAATTPRPPPASATASPPAASP